MIGAAIALIAVVAVAAGGSGDGGSEPVKTVSVVSPVEPTPPSSGGGGSKPNVSPCPISQVYDKGYPNNCKTRRHSPGWVAAEVWIPIRKGSQTTWANSDGSMAVDFEYRDNYSDGEAAVLATISSIYFAPEIRGMPPKDWSERTKALVALVFNDPRNAPQLGRSGKLRFRYTAKGWTIEGASVKKRYSPFPETEADAQTQSLSHQSYPTIYFPKE